ncbi:MAG: OmpA family protein [Rhodoplanes sp.]|jgi:outer membrane protein OmpA-like peptidoglycan-associated protein
MTRWQKFVGAFASLVLASGIVLSATAPSFAQRPTEEQILNALRPAPAGKTRGLTVDRQNVEEQRFVDSIRKVKNRQLTLNERQKAVEIAANRPTIDLEVYFDYDSAAITPRAEDELMTLGRALTNPDLRGNVFLIAGHTDGQGADDYNQRLSERRAAAVKRFLMDKFDLSSESLVAAGYGESRLKDKADPTASENRRVQIANFDQKVSRR